MEYVIFLGKLILCVLGLYLVLILPVMVVWIFLLSKLDKGELLILPFLRSLRESLGNGIRWVIERKFPENTSDSVLQVSRSINRKDQRRIRSLSRVGAVVSDYLLQYCRQSKEAELAKSKFRPKRLRRWATLYRQFIGYGSADIEDAIDHSVNYSFAHAKNFATERPEFYITPRTVEEEQEVEDAIARLTTAVESVSCGSEDSLSSVFEELVRINEYQSMTYQFEPEKHMYVVREPDHVGKINLEDRFQDMFKPAKRGDEDLYRWLRRTFEKFNEDNIIYKQEGKIGRRLAYVFFSMRLILLHLGRMPVFQDSAEYKNRSEAVAKKYTKFFHAVVDYLEGNNEDGVRSNLLYTLGPLLHSIHKLCGNYRVLSIWEMLRRQLGLAWNASIRNISELGYWSDLCKDFETDYKKLMDDARMEGPIFKLAMVAGLQNGRNIRLDDRGRVSESGGVMSGLQGEEMPKKRVWNLLRLLNANREQVSRFVGAAAMVHSPVDYDRIVAIGKCGIVPGSVLSFCFSKRLSVCFLEPLDFFPLPSRLEKLTIIDDTMQTSCTVCVAVENLHRFDFNIADEDVFTVLKYVGSLDPEDNLFQYITHKGIEELRNKAHSIVDYDYPENEEDIVPCSIKDRSNGIPARMIEKIGVKIRALIYQALKERKISIESVLATCKSEVFFKPELLFNKLEELMWLANRWYSKVDKSTGKVGIIATEPLDLPVLTNMALIDRFTRVHGDPIKFFFYDSERNKFVGESYQDDISGMKFFAVDTNVKSGMTLREIKKKLMRKGASLEGCCSLFSTIAESELRQILEMPLVEQYLA